MCAYVCVGGVIKRIQAPIFDTVVNVLAVEAIGNHEKNLT